MQYGKVKMVEDQLEELFASYMFDELCDAEEFMQACANVINKERDGE